MLFKFQIFGNLDNNKYKPINIEKLQKKIKSVKEKIRIKRNGFEGSPQKVLVPHKITQN